jgi:hypothetical protein
MAPRHRLSDRRRHPVPLNEVPVRRVPAIVLSSLLLSLAGFGAFGCGSEVTLRDPTGSGGAGGSTATTSSDATASASSGVTSTGSGGGVFCPGLVVGGESAILVNDGFPTRIALTPGSGDGALSILAYAEGPSELRFIGFSPWNGWPEPLPGPYPSASLEGGESFAVWGAPGDRLGAVFRETTPDGSLLVVAPSVDVMAPGAAMRSPIPTAKRALAASVREAADGRQVLAVVEEESVSPDGLPLFVTRHVLSSPATPLTLSEPDGCSNGPQWASAFPVDFGFRLVTLGAPSGGGCESTGYASALRAILLDSAGGTIALSYLDRGFPIADVAVAPTDTGAVIFHTAIMNALSPLWVIDWHEATGTFGEPVQLTAPFQGYGPIAAATVGPVTAVAYGIQDPSTGGPGVGVSIVSAGKATTHLDLPAVDFVDRLALLGSPYGTSLTLAYSTAKGEVRVMRIDCIGAL